MFKVCKELKYSPVALVYTETFEISSLTFTLLKIDENAIFFLVTYSNEAKQQMLGVGGETLRQHGAVSEETAKEMALGALAYSTADISASITGIAGPDGGSEQKPVGTVCFGWAHRDGRIVTRTHHFSGDREAVRRQSVKTALTGLLQLTLATDL